MRARILLIDDEELVRETYRQALEMAGHIVFLASNGREAMSLLHVAKPDLVITDILMPEKEGIETIIDLRRTDPKIRIIAMSGGGRTGNTDFLVVAERLGANLILTKPVDIDHLCEAVQSVLASPSGKGALERKV